VTFWRLAECAALLAILAHDAHASAQDGACHATGLAPDDELRLVPRAGAVGVALDAPVVLTYGPRVDVAALLSGLDASDVCRGEVACLLLPSSDRAPSTLPSATERLDERTFVIRPLRALPARTELVVVHARPGFDRPTRGQASFETGDDVDREPPVLDVDTAELDLRIEPPPAECDAAAGSLRVRLSVPTPEDDGDPTSVEVLAYLSRSARDAAPSLRARARPGDADQETLTLTLFLSPEEAEGRICVALRAIDGVGRPSRHSPESCFDPAAAERSVFVGSCAAGPPSRSKGCRDGLPGVLLLLAAATAAHRRGAVRGPGARA
jgi:hypothetical protein